MNAEKKLNKKIVAATVLCIMNEIRQPILYRWQRYEQRYSQTNSRLANEWHCSQE